MLVRMRPTLVPIPCQVCCNVSRNVSDKFVTENSGILDLIGEGDHIMADRGFRIEDLLLK